MQGLVNGIRNGATWVRNMIFQIAGNIRTWFAEKLGIKSPSRVFMAFGGNIVDGLTMGVDAGRRDASRSIGGLATATIPMARSPAMLPAAGAGRGAPSVNRTINVTINAAPGQDARAIADTVISRLKQMEGVAARGSYADD
jgi:hypothetical protein